jgi:K+-transporting ATPase ATPase C chain
MKEHIFPAIKLTVVCLIFFSGIYTAAVYVIAQAAPNKGRGFIVEATNINNAASLEKGYYYANIGQSFTQDKYFWSRPSAGGYGTMGSGGSNLAPSNPSFLDSIIPSRIDTFMKHNPGIKKSDIPVELIAASGSGMDPDISVQSALVQIPRIARVRTISEDALDKVVEENTEKPLCGIFGPEKINVLKLNIALDNLK